jgi:hypothetical protein
MKPFISGRVLRAVVVVDGDSRFEEVADGVGEEEMEKICEISLVVAFVVLIVSFFSFSRSTGGCDVATRVG